MEQEQTQLDAVLGALDFDAIAGGSSDPAPEDAEETTTTSEEQPDAPDATEESTASPDADPVATEAAAPTPSAPVDDPKPTVNYDSDDNPYKAEAAEARKIRQALEQMRERYEQEQAAQLRQQRDDEIAERIAKISDEYTPDQAKREAQRIIREVEAEFTQQATPLIQNFQQQIQEREADVQNVAKQLAAFYTTVQRRMPAEEFKALQAEVEYALKFDSPDALEAHFGHVDATTKALRDQLAKQAKQIEELKLAQKAQQRIASGADVAGTGVGQPAVGGSQTRTDDAVARALAAVGIS